MAVPGTDTPGVTPADGAEQRPAPRSQAGRPDPRLPPDGVKRPRAAYREAHQWDHDQAAEQYNVIAEGVGPDLRGDFRMTGDRLRKYEEWPAVGLRPSAQTLQVLSQAYATDPANLLDKWDYKRLPSSDLAALGLTAPGDAKQGSSLLDSIVGQAAVAVGLIAAIIYAAGGLALGLRLWYFKLSWTPVLGQLPRDFILVTAVGQVILPCVIAGAVIGVIIDRTGGAGIDKGGWLKFAGVSLLIAAAAGAALGAVPVATLFFTQRGASQLNQAPPGLLQSGIEIFLVCGIFSMVTVLAALWVIRVVRKHDGMNRPLQVALTMAVAALALIPCVASVSSAYLLPPAVLCAPTFLHPVSGHTAGVPGFMRGNLIGSNSQWAYLAQFHFNSHGSVDGRWITAIPASAIELEGIGRGSGCGNLQETLRQSGTKTR